MDFFTSIVILASLLVATGAALKYARHRLHERLEELRTKLGLTESVWEENGLRILLMGRTESTPVSLAARPWGPIQVRVDIPATLPLGLSLTPQGDRSHLRGLQDLQVGISDLDAHFQVQSEHPSAAIRYLREERTQRALRRLIAADPKAAVTHGEVRLMLAPQEASGRVESTVQLASSIARELAEATGAPDLPEARPTPPPSPAPPEESRPTAPGSSGLIQPRFSPGHVASIQSEHRIRKLLLQVLYLASAAWASVITLDHAFGAGILFTFRRRHPAWGYIVILSVGAFALLRVILRRCASCNSPIGEGYGVTRLVGQQRITCTYCGIRLQ